MATTLNKPLEALLDDATIFRFARLFELTRSDAVAIRLTDHNGPITYLGNTFTPVGGLDSSARDSQDPRMRPSNTEVRGVLSSSAITHDDLRDGLYQDADLVVYQIDWRYPWLGHFKKRLYKINDLEFTDLGWTADLTGRAVLLLAEKGEVVSRACDADLGDTRCGVAMGPFTFTGKTVASVVSTKDRLRFTSTDLTADVAANLLVDELGARVLNGFFDDGELTWTGGSNSGQTVMVRRYTETGGTATIWLWEPTRESIDAGDTFAVKAGCNKLDHCVDKFQNRTRFRGYPFVPGDQALLKTPRAK